MPDETQSDRAPLFDQLFELGSSLPVSAIPAPAAMPQILAGLVRYTETGSLEPPPVEETPGPAAQAAATAENQRIAALEDELNAERRRNQASEAGPSPVLPAPTAADQASTAGSDVQSAPAEAGTDPAASPAPDRAGAITAPQAAEQPAPPSQVPPPTQPGADAAGQQGTGGSPAAGENPGGQVASQGGGA